MSNHTKLHVLVSVRMVEVDRCPSECHMRVIFQPNVEMVDELEDERGPYLLAMASRTTPGITIVNPPDSPILDHHEVPTLLCMN